MGILSILLVAAAMVAGCVAEQNSNLPNATTPYATSTLGEYPEAQAAATSAVSEPVTASQSPALATTPPLLPSTLVPTPTSTVYPKFPDPFVKNLVYGPLYKSDISNCVMLEAFPEIASDPMYGLINVRDLKLTTVSATRMQQFERDYLPQNTTSNIFITAHCYGLPDTPYWNFLEVKALIQAQNARPATYNITFVIQYQGVDGPEISTAQKLVPDQILPYYLYIPIPTRDIGYITGMKLKFNQTA